MAEVLPFKVDSAMARRIIKAAVVASHVGFLPHASKQMKKRRISMAQILACLEKGVIAEGPYVDIKGYWRCTMERLCAGDEISVVVSFNSRESVIVITAM